MEPNYFVGGEGGRRDRDQSIRISKILLFNYAAS